MVDDEIYILNKSYSLESGHCRMDYLMEYDAPMVVDEAFVTNRNFSLETI